ncbi:MAG: hypothetical protein ACD_81C00083G0001 [uncultured bacterium]|uniref:Transcriptional regulator n=1 Tax=Candidatus Wolfebacteria bacterium GW2011_GWE2_44_13 TaxID=1619017 RepID=A0A0G1K6J5_9BACT|nr:MAG: hypothetical protein ACD_81C00083G0001 [uncultured bacterium]KKT43484.1 MAG: hypothetical protein UW32_C0001G0076 [Candidatus Wolfebacteria bacterium GW2011_GWE2_44_13]
MAGHSHAANVKHKKAANDKKRAKVFSKLIKAISIAARDEANPQFNPRLRTAIDTAVESQVPKENIDRAIKKASEPGEELEELTMEAYGPEGSALIITAITDNKNRTVSEVKLILKKQDAKWADPGSVLWAFEKDGDGWNAKFPQAISAEGMEKLETLIEALDDHDDVDDIYVNCNMSEGEE